MEMGGKPMQVLRMSDLTDLAIEIWRIRSRLGAIATEAPKSVQGLQFSVDRATEILSSFGVEIVDHTLQLYREGLSVEVIHGTGDHIVETVRPTVKYNGRVVVIGQVIVGS
jgi:hypothetical protein